MTFEVRTHAMPALMLSCPLSSCVGIVSHALALYSALDPHAILCAKIHATAQKHPNPYDFTPSSVAQHFQPVCQHLLLGLTLQVPTILLIKTPSCFGSVFVIARSPVSMQCMGCHATKHPFCCATFLLTDLISGLIVQGMGARLRRDNLRRTWVPTGKDLKRLEEERGVVIRFVIGYRSVLQQALLIK